MNNRSYNPLLSLTITATQAIDKNKFVDYNGAICGDGELALGVSDGKYAIGEKAAIITHGTAVLSCSEALEAGDAVSSDAEGNAKLTGEDEIVVGYALHSADEGQYVTVLLRS